MGRAYEAHFRPLAEEARKEGNSKGGKSTAGRQTTSEPIVSAAKAATAVGMSERQYRRGKTITAKQNPRQITGGCLLAVAATR